MGSKEVRVQGTHMESTEAYGYSIQLLVHHEVVTTTPGKRSRGGRTPQQPQYDTLTVVG